MGVRIRRVVCPVTFVEDESGPLNEAASESAERRGAPRFASALQRTADPQPVQSAIDSSEGTPARLGPWWPSVQPSALPPGIIDAATQRLVQPVIAPGFLRPDRFITTTFQPLGSSPGPAGWLSGLVDEVIERVWFALPRLEEGGPGSRWSVDDLSLDPDRADARQASAAGQGAVASDPSIALPETERRALEPIVGTDLPEVRLHTGETAARTAAALGAEAFAVGSHLFFGTGKYAPETPRGRALLAHELVHVRQQAVGGATRLQAKDGGADSAESEAQAVEGAVLSAAAQGGALTVGHYVRRYQTEDGSALRREDQRRLEVISRQALRICQELLGPALFRGQPRTLAQVQVAVQLDLRTSSDEQLARIWGHALAEAIRAQGL